MHLSTPTGRASWAAALILALALAMGACAQPPEKALADAEQALREAVVVSECAKAEFAEAEAMLAEARRLVEAGDYDEAEVKARSARTLAERARKLGEERWEDCQKAKATPPVEVVKDDIDGLLKDGRLGTIYFTYDEATLSDEAQKTLQANAEWIRRHPEAKVTIEGHCDERGTAEYNLSLGERRASAVRKYLIQLGIEGPRLDVLSYGAEMPAVEGNTDESLSKNRRAEFAVK